MPDITKPPFRRVAELHLSGAVITVGTLHGSEGSAIFLATPEIDEPIYMSEAEADVLISALIAAIDPETQQ